MSYSIYGRGLCADAPPVSVIEDGVPADEIDAAVAFYNDTGDYAQVWARDHSQAAPFVPSEVEDAAADFGLDLDDDTRSVLAGIIAEDPDLFGDWDRSQLD